MIASDDHPLQDLPLDDFLLTAQQAAQLGGDVLLDWLGRAAVTNKGPRDLVTEADFASQNTIAALLADQFPEHGFLGEEAVPDAQLAQRSSPFRWIVDPLDGTTNYVHQLPGYSVSVALQYRGRSIVGAVWDPVLKEMYSAAAGQGAHCNGRPIEVSQCQSMADSIWVVSLTRGVQRDSPEVQQMLALLEAAGSLRRLGSAALNLCYLAGGRLDGYWATRLKIWDVAAGFLIAQEAGAVMQQVDGQAVDWNQPTFLCASSNALLQQAQQVM